LAQNVAVVSLPKSADCKLKHIELLSLQESQVLVVVVLQGAKVKQKLINLDQPVSQSDLTAISSKLNAIYTGLTGKQIADSEMELSPLDKQATDHLIEILRAEDSQEYEEPYLDGWHFMLNQPEFRKNDRMQSLIELVEQRSLLKVIIPEGLSQHTVHVIIGEENKEQAIKNCSVVISRYGLAEEVTGTLGVVGPTRMAYSHTIPTVHYLSSVLSELMGSLYGKGKGKE
jgi:heat-inducible transcriptional repressor